MAAPVSILLPGMDGTGMLFERFLAAAPPGFPARPLPLPNDRPRSYPELADWALSQLPASPFALIAESFSGPLALLVADRCPRVTAVVLCASFVEPPLPGFLARSPGFVFHVRPPLALIRFLWTGGDAGLAREVRRAVATVPGEVVADRVSSVLRFDVTAELQRLDRPLMFIRAGEDRVVPAKNFERARALKPSARFVTIRGPHLVLQSRPAECWRAIEEFLA